MRPATLVVSAAMLAATLSITAAQDLRGNVASGRDLAGHWCDNCHQMAEGGPPARPGVATFTQIARLPSTTALALRVFLRTSHADMPNIQLSETDIDDLIVYILSLKQK
jgi:mono/diheme cytochrome c family protein